MRQYRITVDKQLIKKLTPFWKKYGQISDTFYKQLYKLEKEMSKQVNLEDLEFFFVDNECVGIGKADKTMRLIHGRELEKK